MDRDKSGYSAKTQISPLRSPGFPVETRGVDDLHAALFTAEPHTWTSLATRSRKSGCALVEKHSQEATLKPQISPLRSFGAPVERTKGRAALPLSVVAEQKLFFITGRAEGP